MRIFKRKCNRCNEYYEGYGKKFCSNSCHAKMASENPDKNEINRRVGISSKLKFLYDKDIRKSKIGELRFWKNKSFSKKHRENLSASHLDVKIPDRSGDRHWNWKNGATKYSKLLRNSKRWLRWRKLVFERDNYTCQICGANAKYDNKKVELHPHHIFPVRKLVKTIFEEHIFNVNNGITLCKSCHKRI